MSQVEEPAKKLTIQDRVEEFQTKAFEHEQAKKVLIRNLKGLVHKVVRICRANSPMGEHTPGMVSARRVGDTEWNYRDVQYNRISRTHDFPTLIGMVKSYEISEDPNSWVSLIVAAPGDRFEYRFNLRSCEIEVLDGFPAAE